MCRLKAQTIPFQEVSQSTVQPGFPRKVWPSWLQHFQQKIHAYFNEKSCLQRLSSEEPNPQSEASVQLALQAVGQYLIQQGFSLGQDFSLTDGGILLSQHTSDHLRQKLGDAHCEEVMTWAPGLLQHAPHTALQILDRQLGVPFSGNFKRIMLKRLPTLSESELYQYLLHLLNSFEQRHPEIQAFQGWVKVIACQVMVTEKFEQISRLHKQHLAQFESIASQALIEDLLIAADGVEGVHFEKRGVDLQVTPSGIQLLNQLVIPNADLH